MLKSQINGKITMKNYISNNLENVKCNLTHDTGLFLNILEDHKNLFSEPFTIICAVADTYGFGDTIFFVKFVKYIMKQYPNVKLNIVVSSGKKSFISNILQPIKIYSESGVEDVKGGNSNINMYIGTNYEKNFSVTYTPIPGDVMFVAPKTNIRIDLTFSDIETVTNNAYTLSEYNYSRSKGITINSGIKNISSKNVGILLNSLPTTQNPEKELYSITYIYTGKYMALEFNFKPYKIKFKIDDKNIWNIKTLFSNLEVEIEDWLLYDDNYDFFKETEEHALIVQIKIALSFRDYLDDLDTFTDKPIKVYYRGDSIDNIRDFVNSIELFWIDVLNLANLLYNLNSNPKFTFVNLGTKSHEEMLVLYEHSIPIIFISGDQSITDFVSVNRYYGNEFKNCIYYQIFYWKQRLADYLGCNDYITGKISPNMLNILIKDPEFDFRFKGMMIIHSALLFALQYKIRKIRGYEFISFCPDLGSSKSIESLIKTHMVPNFKKSYADYVTNGKMDNNLKVTLKKNILTIKERPKQFDVRMILGNIKDNTGSWLMGTEVSDIYIKYNNFPDKVSDTNLIVSEIYDCNSLQIKLSKGIYGFVLPININILVVYIMLEKVRHERIIDNNLARTYGSFIIGNDCCNTGIIKRLGITPDVGNINTLLFQENLKDKYITLSKYLKTGVEYFEIIMYKIIFVLKTLQTSDYMIVHNNLTCDNIYLEFIGSSECDVKIVNFDNASFNIKDDRFGSVNSTQFEFNPLYDILFLNKDIIKNVEASSKETQTLVKSILGKIQVLV